MKKYDEIMKKITLSPEARNRIIDNIADEMSSETVTETVRKTSRVKAWKKYLTAAACCVLVVAGAMAASRSDVFINLLGDGASDKATEMESAEEYESGNAGGALTENGSAGGALTEDGQPSEDSSDENVQDVSPSPEGTGRSVTELKKHYWVFNDGYTGYHELALECDSEEELSDRLGFDINCKAFKEVSERAGQTEAGYVAYSYGVGMVTFRDGNRLNLFYKAEGTEDIYEDFYFCLFEADNAIEFDGVSCSGTIEGKGNDYKLAKWVSDDGYTYACYIDGGLTEKEWLKMIDSLTGSGERGK